jgi:hypothetical protein
MTIALTAIKNGALRSLLPTLAGDSNTRIAIVPGLPSCARMWTQSTSSACGIALFRVPTTGSCLRSPLYGDSCATRPGASSQRDPPQFEFAPGAPRPCDGEVERLLTGNTGSSMRRRGIVWTSHPITGALLTARSPTEDRTGEPRPEHYFDYFHAGLMSSSCSTTAGYGTRWGWSQR